jgi:hypothetical protein
MNTIAQYIQKVLLLAFLLSASFSLTAQVKEGLQPTDSLYKKIQLCDSLVFDALNKRDTAAFNNYFDKGLEFYHDQGGLTGYEQTTSFLKSLINQKSDLKRFLLKQSFEVYPIPGYGAMEYGEHRFCHTENGKEQCAVFKFMHVWKNENGNWKITRVISYGH